jgi:hypothetical protein
MRDYRTRVKGFAASISGTLIAVTIDEAFAAVSHAFPQEAEWQGVHFRYATKNGVTLIEQKRSVFVPKSRCDHCGEQSGTKVTRFHYWLLVGDRFKEVHASHKSKFAAMRTVIDSLRPSSNLPKPTACRCPPRLPRRSDNQVMVSGLGNRSVGQDLSQVVKRRGPLPVTNATFYAQQVALGLQHAHEKGMVHRDIKPNNLMLAIEGKKHVVKILDFGLAKATSEKAADAGLTKTGQMLGTPDYIAPEQTLDAQKADIRADIYSLGCTLYFLLSGHSPFQGNSLYEILQAHHQTEAQPLNLVRNDVPAELAGVVSKMMAKNPANRYQTPMEVAKALNPFFKAGTQLPPMSEPRAQAPPPNRLRDRFLSRPSH